MQTLRMINDSRFSSLIPAHRDSFVEGVTVEIETGTRQRPSKTVAAFANSNEAVKFLGDYPDSVARIYPHGPRDMDALLGYSSYHANYRHL